MSEAGSAELEGWVRAAAGGDAQAWQRLWSELEPKVLALLRNPSVLGRFAEREDDCRSVVVVLMERLRADGFRRLRSYLDSKAKRPGLQFMPWLIVVAKRTAIDCVRAHPDYIDRRRQSDASSPGAWVDPASLPPSSLLPGSRPPLTNRGTAMELLRFAEANMPDAQRQAIELWMQSASFDDIARALGLSGSKDAERAVRAGLERLRRHVKEEI
jgi:DNA-directed RNA polymerase specialized sigma24 family protein